MLLQEIQNFVSSVLVTLKCRLSEDCFNQREIIIFLKSIMTLRNFTGKSFMYKWFSRNFLWNEHYKSSDIQPIICDNLA